MFYMLMPNKSARDTLINHLAEQSIGAVFHYLPLENSKMGLKISLADQTNCPVSTDISDRIVRLPIFYDLKLPEQTQVINTINSQVLEG